MDKSKLLAFLRLKAKTMEEEFAEVIDSLADQIEDMPEDVASREKVYTRIHKDSPIAYPSWKCSHCGFEDRYRKGSFCKMCGWRFSDG